MFEKFKFTAGQIGNYCRSAERDLAIARKSQIPEVIFRFAYDALLKLAIAACAQSGLRAKSRQGHHIELIRKLAEFLDDEDVEILGNQMRSKRNWDLYGGGTIISAKEAKEYFDWVVKVFAKAQKLFDGPNRRLNL
ncbi:MAG TPA: hypothetical protein PKK37_04895 [Candidatus Pacearchaeota archaeon]|jgi:hypothetical protein|nr:MAG: hypothetical protein YFSK_2940 [Candidatus Yanofskybacteria bacterium]HNR81747.1 hypothetical protein [Candidatus Pacearchaeota archaeon]